MLCPFSIISNCINTKNYENSSQNVRIHIPVISNFWPFHTHLKARSFSKKAHFENSFLQNFVKVVLL